MPRTDTPAVTAPLFYSLPARVLHWTVALLVLITAPLGFIMHDRSDTKIADESLKAAFEATTDMMYSWHKLIGLVILALMVFRLSYRFMNGAPRPEPTLTPLEKGLSHAVHWTMYLLLIVIPVVGYIGISYGDYLTVFGMKLPGLVSVHEGDGHDKIADWYFDIHGWAATILLGLAGLHILAALYHRFVKGDRVLARMVPGRDEGAGSDVA